MDTPFADPQRLLKLETLKKSISSTPNWTTKRDIVNPLRDITFHDPVQHISRSYYKIFELLHNAQLRPQKILCLCEAPGGFAEALRERFPHADIYAVSLPCNVVFHREDLKCLYIRTEYEDIAAFSSTETYDLVTADGAFDASGDFLRQEESHSNLIEQEYSAAVNLLNPGGTLILKLFGCVTEKTARLLFRAKQEFNEIHLLKPLTSRPCNSERYLVAYGFRGKTGPASQPFNEPFRNELTRINNECLDRQIQAIQRALEGTVVPSVSLPFLHKYVFRTRTPTTGGDGTGNSGPTGAPKPTGKRKRGFH